MHDYSIDQHPKEKVLFVLAFGAITAAPWLNRGITTLSGALGSATGLWSSPIVTAVPVFGLFLALYWLFNTKLWRVRWLRKLLLVPDLNGVWTCEGLSVLRKNENVDHKWTGEVRITQSWSKILIHLKTGQSSSESVSASISQIAGVGYRLLYSYSSNPRSDQIELRKHDGVADIVFTEDRRGDGHYFTDQHRSTTGTMKLTKV